MPVEGLRQEGLELMGLFYNPNIQPYAENRRRRQTLEAWAGGEGLGLIVQDHYDIQKWLRQVVLREASRCGICHHQRLTRAAKVAKRGGFDAFSSTLLYSRMQKHDLIAETGRAVAAQEGVPFLYRDWRPWWKEGQERARALELYRQDYCGCVYSESERHLGPAGRPRALPSSSGER